MEAHLSQFVLASSVPKKGKLTILNLRSQIVTSHVHIFPDWFKQERPSLLNSRIKNMSE